MENMMIVWIAILVVLVAVVILVATYALPGIYLRLRCKTEASQDRCIKRVYETNGQSLIFEPEQKWRKYMSQYILSERKERKVLVCKVDKKINYLEYDIVVFNAINEVEKVIRIKDLVNGAGITKEVELPKETSYLAVKVARVETLEFEDEITGKLKKGQLAKYIFLNVAVVLLEVFFFKICIANLLGGIFRESVILSPQGLLLSAILAVALIVVNSLVSLITVKVREHKYTTKGKNNA